MMALYSQEPTLLHQCVLHHDIAYSLETTRAEAFAQGTNQPNLNQPISIGYNTFIDSSKMSLGKALTAAGYFTGMSSKWHIGDSKEILE